MLKHDLLQVIQPVVENQQIDEGIEHVVSFVTMQ